MKAFRYFRSVLEPTQQLTEKTNKNEKQRFRFSNLFITKFVRIVRFLSSK